MDLTERKKLIKERFEILFGSHVKVIAPTKADELEEISLVERAKDNSSIIDEELNGFKSRLQFQKATNENEGNCLLSKAEKFLVKLEVDFSRWEKSKARNTWLSLV